jgi:aspartate racemase
MRIETGQTMEAINDTRATALGRRIAALSPAKRALLEQRLQHRQTAGHPGGPPGSKTMPAPAAAALERVPRDQPLPLSPNQWQLWFLDQLEPGSALYTLSLVHRLKGPLRVPALQRSLTGLVRRHESLRMVFPRQDNEPRLRILPEAEVLLEMIPMAASPTLEAEGLRQAEAFVRRPFDLAQGPVFRAGLVRLAPDDHILALAVHHIVSDGWSLEVMQRDLVQGYASALEDRDPDWAPLPVQFADYAGWQRKQLENGALTRQLDYWRHQLAGIPARLELPADQPRPARQAHLGAEQLLVLDADLTQALKRLALTRPATLFLVMLGAFEVLLQRLSGQDDFVVGAPMNDRRLAEMEEVTGFFMNSLPLRADLSGTPTFLEVLERCRETFYQAIENQDAPFQQVVAQMPAQRDLSQNPVFQVFINHLSFERTDHGFAGLHTERIMPVEADAKFDLTLYFAEVDGGLKLRFLYDRSLFSTNRMAEMARQFEFLLRQVVEAPDRLVQSYSLITPAARARLPEPARFLPATWTGGPADWFRKQAGRTPDATAVVLEGDLLTYRELDLRSTRLAQELQKRGVGPEVLTGVFLERTLEMPVALLAVLKAGGVLVPLEPGLPAERMAFILEDTQMPWLLTQSALLSQLPATGARKLCLDQVPDSTSDAPAREMADPGVKPEHLAYIIYTSGSTGRPKGVMITQAAYLSYCGAVIDFWKFGPADRFLQFARFGFDVGLDQLLTPLLAGATVVMRGAELWEPAVLTQIIQQQRVTRLHLPPAYWQKWVESLDPDASRESLRTLRLVQVGGDVMPLTAVQRWQSLNLSGVRLFNRYGPTEATMFSLAYEVPGEPAAAERAARIPIGRPVGPRTCYILDVRGNPVPEGATGEIHLGGETLARGYWNRPELTAERFIPDPFSGQPGARLYKTGDLGRRLADGSVDFLGRADLQVKIRSYRIELGEIEAVLGGHPAVATCAVVAKDHRDGDKLLVAYTVSRQKDAPAPEVLRQWLGQKLPDYMIPSRFVWLDRLPLNSSGKVDRKALTALETTDERPRSETRRPVNLLELELLRIWRRLFQREDLSTQDNFFALGGHSLLAVRLAAEIDKLLGCKLPIATLFQTPTVELLARRLADDQWAPPWSSLVPLQPQGSRPPLFCVHGWAGDVFVFLGLAALLPPDQPVYGIQAVGLDGRSPRHFTIEAMAAHYAREMISFQPEGPLHLAGYSLGGVVAYEIARQLQSQGRRVALLALLDSEPIGRATPWIFYALAMGSYLPRRCQWHFRQWWKLPPADKLRYLPGRWAALWYWLERFRSQPAPVTAPPPPDSQPPQVPGFSDYYQAVAQSYQLRPYAGTVDLFVSDEAKSGWRWYWRRLVRGGISYHRVPGNHAEIMFSPDRRAALAKSLTQVLQHAQEKETSATSF